MHTDASGCIYINNTLLPDFGYWVQESWIIESAKSLEHCARQ